MNTEPIWTANGLVAFLSAVIALGVTFGLQISAEQKVAIVGVAAFIAPLIAAWWSRKQTTPLVAPKDVDGLPLVKPGGALPIKVAERARAERGRA